MKKSKNKGLSTNEMVFYGSGALTAAVGAVAYATNPALTGVYGAIGAAGVGAGTVIFGGLCSQVGGAITGLIGESMEAAKVGAIVAAGLTGYGAYEALSHELGRWVENKNEITAVMDTQPKAYENNVTTHVLPTPKGQMRIG